MSLLIYSDTINSGAYGHSPSVTGLLYLTLNNLSTQASTVSIIVSNNGVSTIIDNAIVGPNSEYTSSSFEVSPTSIITIQSTTQLNFNLYTNYPNYQEFDYIVDNNYIEPVTDDDETTTTIPGTSAVSPTQGATVSTLLANLQTQIQNLNTQYSALFTQYANSSNAISNNSGMINTLNTEYSELLSNFTSITNQVNAIAITQNLAIIQGANSVFQSIASQTTASESTVSDPITLQGPNGGSLQYVIVKNSIYQKIVFNFTNYVNNSNTQMTVAFPYSFIYLPYVNNSGLLSFTLSTNSISFNSSSTINGVMVIEGLISTTLNNSSYYQTNGQSSGSIDIYYATDGSITKYVMLFNQYMNNTTNNQVITLPVGFSNSALVNTTMALEMIANGSSFTITSPDSTTLYTGMVILEGI